MRIVPVFLAMLLSLPAAAQDDACGRSSLEAMDKAAPEKDPAMQAKIEHLRATLWEGYEQCVETLARRQAREEALGLTTFPSTPVADKPQEGVAVAKEDSSAVCSVVSSTGIPCVRKSAEIPGVAGVSDQVVFANSCSNPVDIMVVYGDQSRGMATVKAGGSATLLCNGCGGVKSIESLCR